MIVVFPRPRSSLFRYIPCIPPPPPPPAPASRRCLKWILMAYTAKCEKGGRKANYVYFAFYQTMENCCVRCYN